MQPHQWFDTGIGGPKGPGLPANFHRPSTVAAAFADTHIAGSAQPVVGAGSPAKGPALPTNFHRPFTVAAATVFAGKPAPTHGSGVQPHQGFDTGIGGGPTSVVRRRPLLDSRRLITHESPPPPLPTLAQGLQPG
ncbi:hypothetical protein CRM86_02600 [Pseudomonas putida]|nr:hypothetical protein CRM86_02600 [Pseudomonas putida]